MIARWRWYHLALILAAFWLVSGAAFAQITYAVPGGAYQPLDGATVKGRINVRTQGCAVPTTFALDGKTQNTENVCPVALIDDNAYLDTTTLGEGSHTVAVSGAQTFAATFTVDNIADPTPAPAPPAAFVPPRLVCLPLPRMNGDIYSLPQGVSLRFTHIGVWSCDTPTRIVNHWFLFSWSEAAAVARKAISLSEAQDNCNRVCVPLTQSEIDYGLSMARQYGASAKVAANGTAKTRPVYAANPDGTRNGASRPERVAVGASCNIAKRLVDSAGKGTSYFSVEGVDDIATAASDAIGPLYALCTLSTPLGLN